MNNKTIKADIYTDEYQNFKKKIDDLVVKNNLSWEKSLEAKRSMGKAGFMLAPFAISLLLLSKIFDIFNIQNSNERIIPFFIAIFAVWAIFQTYKLLLKTKSIISPWTMGWINNALETKKIGKIQKSKLNINLWMGIFFLFFGFISLFGETKSLTGKITILAMSFMFIFLGILGILNFKSWKKPEIVLYFLKNNYKINLIIFFFISLICLGFIISPIIFYFSI